MAAKVAYPKPEREPKVAEAPEPESEVKESEVEKLPSETLVDLPAEPTMELVSSLTAMRASLSLRSPDVYDQLQFFLHESRSQVIWLFMVHFSQFSFHHG